MTTYVTLDKSGRITASADWAFPEAIMTEKNIVRGYDGQLYFLGEEPAKPEPVLEELKEQKLIELKEAFKIASSIAHCTSTAGFEINANETANGNVSSLIIAMEATGQKTARFCAYDNTFHEVTLDQLKTMQLEIIAHTQGLYQRKWALRGAIEAAHTQEELERISVICAVSNEETA